MTATRRSHLAIAAALGLALSLGGTARAGDGEKGEHRGQAHGAGSSPRESGQLAAWLQEFHAANLAVTSAAELALQKASPAEMKEYAERLRDERRQLDSQLREVANQLEIDVEGDTFERMRASAMNKTQALEQKSGARFEQAFIEHVTEQHRRTAAVIEAAKTSAARRDHPQLAAFLEGASRSLTANLSRAKQLSTSLAHGGADATSTRPSKASHAQRADEMLTGIVASVTPEGRRIVIAPDVGRSAELRIVPETRVTVNGRQARLQDIEPGAEVRVSYQQRESDPVAVAIDVRRDAAAAEYGREDARQAGGDMPETQGERPTRPTR